MRENNKLTKIAAARPASDHEKLIRKRRPRWKPKAGCALIEQVCLTAATLKSDSEVRIKRRLHWQEEAFSTSEISLCGGELAAMK